MYQQLVTCYDTQINDFQIINNIIRYFKPKPGK